MSSAYYNENDTYAAQWLRNLIAAGHIAPGDVDERSIEDVRASDLRGYTQCHFFAGIGVWSYALRLAGWPDDRRVWTGSCPCQPFSAAGKGAGMDDERHLWPAWFHLISQCRPDALYGEQVASKDVDPWIDLVQDDMEGLGYPFAAVAFPSAGIGAPHIRDRAYWVAHSERIGRYETRLPLASARTEIEERATTRIGNAGASSVVGHPDEGRGGRNGRAIPGAQGGIAGGVRRVVDGVEFAGAIGVMADTDGRDAGAERQQRGREQRFVAPDSGAVRGFWADAEWIACRDGKWRPVEPGTFPLAHGAPARVGRLRAYGNAINAEAAAAFIRATL